MNQGKLEVVKQMARVNIDVLGMSELKWTGMDSDDPYIYYCGQESLRRNGIAPIVKCSTWVQNAVLESEMQYLGAISKTTE